MRIIESKCGCKARNAYAKASETYGVLVRKPVGISRFIGKVEIE
jgi:hypothetical protein